MAPLARAKRFLSSRYGRILLIAIAALVTVGAYLVGGVLFAIVAAILFGLGLPIWVGASQPRYLAIVGVAILVVSPAIIGAVEVPLLLTPLGPSASAGGSSAVLQNATLSPFTGSAGNSFNWSVQIFPMFLPNGSTVRNLTLYLSTCPGATGPNSATCSAGYPFYNWTTLSVNGTKVVTTHLFTEVVPSANIWSWQMSLGYLNATGNASYVYLVGDPQYNGIQGPVTILGWGLYGLILSSVYIQILLYLGLSFFVVLLIYVIYRLRKQRQTDAASRAQGPAVAPAAAGAEVVDSSAAGGAGTGTALPSSSPPPSRPPATQELGCPNCGAVVYPKETFCWKCGASLSGGGPTPPPKG